MKAGDGGNGRRGADGVGGSDSSGRDINITHRYNESPQGLKPGKGELGGNAGMAGAKGTAYYYSNVSTAHAATEEEPYTISGTLLTGSNGAEGLHGNDGWSGLNLRRYTYHKESGAGPWYGPGRNQTFDEYRIIQTHGNSAIGNIKVGFYVSPSSDWNAYYSAGRIYVNLRSAINESNRSIASGNSEGVYYLDVVFDGYWIAGSKVQIQGNSNYICYYVGTEEDFNRNNATFH